MLRIIAFKMAAFGMAAPEMAASNPSYFADFEQVKKLTIKPLTTASCHWHSTLAPQTCKGLHQLWALTCNLRDAMPRQGSLTLSHVTYGTPCHARGYLQSDMWLMGRYATPGSLTLSHVTCRTPCHARGHLHSRMWLAGCHAAPGVTYTHT